MPDPASPLVVAPADDPRVWRPGQRLRTIGLVLLITIAASEALTVATVMPLVERELGELSLYGWVFSAFFLGSLLGIVVAGRLADRMPPVVPLLGGLTMFGAGLVAAGAAPSMSALVAARAVQGVGAGAIPAVAYACVARAYTPAARPRVFALFSTAWIVPALVGPGVAGVVGEGPGWRWVFLGLVPLVVVAGAVTAVGVGSLDAPATPAEGVALVPAAGLVVASAALLAGLRGSAPAASVVLVLGGGAGVVATLRRLLPPGVFAVRPGLPATVALKGMFTFAFFAADAFVPLALTDLRDVSARYAGAVVTTVSLAWAAAASVQERLVRHRGPRPLVRVGFVCVGVGCAGMAAITVVAALPVWLSFGVWAVAGLGAGLLYAPLSASALATAEPGAEGAASSSMQLADTLGVALGTGMAGAAVAAMEGAGHGLRAGIAVDFVAAAGVAAVGALLALRIPRSVLSETPPGG